MGFALRADVWVQSWQVVMLTHPCHEGIGAIKYKIFALINHITNAILWDNHCRSNDYRRCPDQQWQLKLQEEGKEQMELISESRQSMSSSEISTSSTSETRQIQWGKQRGVTTGVKHPFPKPLPWFFSSWRMIQSRGIKDNLRKIQAHVRYPQVGQKPGNCADTLLAKLPVTLARAPCWAHEAGELFAFRRSGARTPL